MFKGMDQLVCALSIFSFLLTHPHIHTHIHNTSGFIHMLQMNKQELKRHTRLYFISRTIQSSMYAHTHNMYFFVAVVPSISFCSCCNCFVSDIVCNINSKYMTIENIYVCACVCVRVFVYWLSLYYVLQRM